MANLSIPNKNKHKYVVGIDIGHGETSAAIVPIEWDKLAGQREIDVQDIDLDIKARKKVITSAIYIDNYESPRIGDQAFEHITDNRGIRLCFKQKPQDINGEAEKLMIEFMKCIYGRIRECQVELTDENHIVYLARPSGWADEKSKELYKQMALEAGIPLGALTSESRAAIFYAKTPKVNFTNTISKGAIVFDLGSSTLDLTFLSDECQPIDYGYNLGASIIDNSILDNMILVDNNVREFLNNYPEYRDALSFKARKFKENAYSRDEDLKTVDSLNLESVIPETEESYDKYKDISKKLKIANLAELNQMVENTTNYMSDLRKAMVDFKETKIPNYKVNGVFLTGGASRMNFIRPIIADVFDLPKEDVRIDGDNPSLTISRGIAILGATDAITSVLVTELEKKTSAFVKNDRIIEELTEALSENISNNVWNEIDKASSEWVITGSTTKLEELKSFVEKQLKCFQESGLQEVVDGSFQSYIDKKNKKINKSMNDIIRLYAPDREISLSVKAKMDSINEINKIFSDLSLSFSSVSDILRDIVVGIYLTVLAIVLSWILYAPLYLLLAPYFIGKYLFCSAKTKRKNKVSNVLKKKGKIIADIKSKIASELNDNVIFKNEVVNVLHNYFNSFINSNLQRVKIPIE